mmetsp:Transcript_16128/g.22277  ORF Transcript_16128/g.22277 Transcript_16128/m.22277 type:complete len:145 (-) Transcript_16128:208-642(-)
MDTLIGEEKQVGFAKLQGKDFEYFVQKYEIKLGRRSKSSNVDIVLGDNMNLSRHHASIIYSFERGCFELEVLGKNGVTVSDKFLAPGHEPFKLNSQDRMQVGDVIMYFLLPPKSLPSSKKAPSTTTPRNRPSGGPETAAKKLRS